MQEQNGKNAWGGPPGPRGSPWTRSSLAESGACNWREAGPGGPARTGASAPQAARPAALVRIARVFFRNRVVLVTKQHACREQITCGRVPRHIEHLAERLACLRVVFSLDVTDAQNVRSVDVGSRVPALDFL